MVQSFSTVGINIQQHIIHTHIAFNAFNYYYYSSMKINSILFASSD